MPRWDPNGVVHPVGADVPSLEGSVHIRWCPECQYQFDYAILSFARESAEAACTCSTDPYNCPERQALVQAIHDRKTAQGDG